MLSNIWHVKYNMVVRLLIILIVNYLMPMVMTTSKKEYLVMNTLSSKLFKKDLELQPKKDSNIKSLPIQITKSVNIENILILFLQLITLKSLDSIQMLILHLDWKNLLKWSTHWLKQDPKILVEEEESLKMRWSKKRLEILDLNYHLIIAFKKSEILSRRLLDLKA